MTSNYYANVHQVVAVGYLRFHFTIKASLIHSKYFGKEEGGNNLEGTSVCASYATQYIENTACIPAIVSGVFAFGSSATLSFTSAGGDAGKVTLSTSDRGNSLWAETYVQKGENTIGMWFLRLPSPPKGRPPIK